MDTEFFNSIQEDHQLAMMLMQMDKFPEFSTPFSYNKPQEMPINFGTNNMPQVLDNCHDASTTISFPTPPQQNVSPITSISSLSSPPSNLGKRNTQAGAMREMIYRIAAMQPIYIDPESVKPPKRKNVKISKDPQSVAARHRRERISERMRILQRLVPGGTKMDTASMLDEAIHYVKFLKNQVQSLQHVAATTTMPPLRVGYFPGVCCGSYLPAASSTTRSYHRQPPQNVQHFA